MATSTERPSGSKGENISLQSGIPRQSGDNIVFKGKGGKKGSSEGGKKEVRERREVPGTRRRRGKVTHFTNHYEVEQSHARIFVSCMHLITFCSNSFQFMIDAIRALKLCSIVSMTRSPINLYKN